MAEEPEPPVELQPNEVLKHLAQPDHDRHRRASMARPIVDITGQRFGKLVAVRRVGSRGRNPLWECQCDCGSTHQAMSVNLRSGGTKSCGCIKPKQPERKRRRRRVS
jgi:hypothetical protein